MRWVGRRVGGRGESGYIFVLGGRGSAVRKNTNNACVRSGKVIGTYPTVGLRRNPKEHPLLEEVPTLRG